MTKVARRTMPMRVNFQCRLSAATTPLRHVWEHTVGSCHAPLALRADWQAQLRRCHAELGFQPRPLSRPADATMSDTLVRVGDRSLYSFFNADRIVDFLLSIGMQAVRGTELHACGARLGRRPPSSPTGPT